MLYLWIFMIKLTIIVAILIATTGCSSDSIKSDKPKFDKSKLGVVFNSNPHGALIVCDGISSGYTPSVQIFTYTEEEKVSGRSFIPACSLKWASGATVDIKKTDISSTNYGLSFSASENGYIKNLTEVIQRPNVPGYDKDAEFALKLEAVNAQNRQADAAQRQAISSQIQADAAQRSASLAAQANIDRNNNMLMLQTQQQLKSLNDNMRRNQIINNYNMSTWGNNSGWKPILY